MRSFRHWTPRYIKNRIKSIIFKKRFPSAPWLTKEAVNFLSTFLRESDNGFEWGSGKSTIWFAKRVSKIISIEHDKLWYNKITSHLKKFNIPNVEYYLLRGNDYHRKILDFEDNFFDFILVDGDHRDKCSLNSISKLRHGGILIIDNINWFLPCNSKAPSSKRFLNEDKDEDRNWAKFMRLTETWRYYWTTNGVSDTAFYFKPLSDE